MFLSRNGKNNKSNNHELYRKAQSQVLSIILISGILVTVVGATYMWGVPLIEKGRTSSDNELAESFMLLLKEKVDDVAETGEQRTLPVELIGDLELREDNSLTYTIVTRGLNIATTAWVPLAGGMSPVQEDMAAVAADGGTGTVNINDDVTCTMTSTCGASPNVNLLSCTGGFAGGVRSEGGTYDINGESYLVHHIDCVGDIDGQALIVGPEREKAGIVGIDEAGVLIAKSEPAGDRFKTIYRLAYRELDDISTPSKDGYRIQLTREGNNILGPGQHRITIRRDENSKIIGASKHGGDLIGTKIFISMS
ncbi:MAG: hypothetical protein DRN71_00870 [Candidatus Nanohalarchaeota archaeon]|nr:MAG: hypothetical protein DRN71_00870 [Candidatus Nanohaloarchaeota archaeon]